MDGVDRLLASFGPDDVGGPAYQRAPSRYASAGNVFDLRTQIADGGSCHRHVWPMDAEEAWAVRDPTVVVDTWHVLRCLRALQVKF